MDKYTANNINKYLSIVIFFEICVIIALIIAYPFKIHQRTIKENEAISSELTAAYEQVDKLREENKQLRNEIFEINHPDFPWQTKVYGTDFYYMPAELYEIQELDNKLWVMFVTQNEHLFSIMTEKETKFPDDVPYLLCMQDIDCDKNPANDIIVNVWIDK